MKITTKMKRNATSERGGKRSKNTTSNTDIITSFLDQDHLVSGRGPQKKKKEKHIPVIGDIVCCDPILIHPIDGGMTPKELRDLQIMGGRYIDCMYKGEREVEAVFGVSFTKKRKYMVIRHIVEYEGLEYHTFIWNIKKKND